MRTASCVALAFMGTAHGLPIFSAERRQLVNLAPELNPEILSGDNSCFGLGVSVCDPIDVTEKGPSGGPKAIKPPAKPPSDDEYELPGKLQGKPKESEDDEEDDDDGEDLPEKPEGDDDDDHEDYQNQAPEDDQDHDHIDDEDDNDDDDNEEDDEKPKGKPEDYTGGKGPPLSKLLGGGKGDDENSEGPSGPLGKLLGMLPLPKPGGKGEEQSGDSSGKGPTGGRLPLPELPMEKKPSSSSSSSPLEALPLPRPSSQEKQEQQGASSPLEALPLPRPSSQEQEQQEDASSPLAALPLPRPSSQEQQEEDAPSPFEELPLPRPSSQNQEQQESSNAASSLVQSGISKLQSVDVPSKIEELMIKMTKSRRQLLGPSVPEIPGSLKSLAEDPPAISLINVSPEANPEVLAGDNTCSGLGASACDPIDVSEGGGKLPVLVPAPPANKGAGESKWTKK